MMLCTTKGIVLHAIPYNDKYLILHIYTENFGRASYLLTNTRSKKAKVPHSLLMPLSVLEMVVEHANNRDIYRIKEAHPAFHALDIHHCPIKRALALFLAEVLYRVIQEKEPNKKLFDYLSYSVKVLEVSESGIGNFHLAFLFQLSNYIGIHPNGETYKNGYLFDLLSGCFISEAPRHQHYLNLEESAVFSRLLKMNFENMSLFRFSRSERINIVRQIIDYYRFHVDNFPEIKSLAVMQSLFDE